MDTNKNPLTLVSRYAIIACEYRTFTVTDGSGCTGFKSNYRKYTIQAGKTKEIITGAYISVPEGYCLMLFSCPGWDKKHNIVVVAPCIIDQGFKGIAKIMLRHNGKKGDKPFIVKPGTMVAQGALIPLDLVVSGEVLSLEDVKAFEAKQIDQRRG